MGILHPPFLLGIIFDTQGCEGNSLCYARCRFRYLNVARVIYRRCVAYPLFAGYRFRYPGGLRGDLLWAYYTLLFCWVSFSIPRRVPNAWFGKLGCLLFAESRGGIRIHMNRDGKYGTIEMAIKPTAEQKRKLRSFINAVGGNVDIDFVDENYNTTHAVSYEGVSPTRALSGITTFYDKGIKPKGNVSYSINREDIDAERREIERKAKADDTWLKAPNGEDTNLSPKQWIDVRTKAFKEWFGDWELASKIVDIIKIENAIHFSNIAEARRWAKANIVGICSNPEIGDVNISKESINKYLSEKAVKQSTSLGLHLSCLQKMPSIINSSIVGEIHKDKNNDKNILDIVRLYGCVTVDGELCRVKTTVKRYVDANLKTKAYSYEVTEIELLDGSLETHTHSADSSSTSNNSITGAKLLKGVKKSNSNEEILSCSKVLDENGEPKVMYHGSSWRPLLEADGKAVFNMEDGALGKGAYFSSSYQEAVDYARDSLDNWDLSEDEIDEGGYVTEVFLNVRDDAQMLRDNAYGNDSFIVVATSPNQIKSATENVGTYSAENADIRYSINRDETLADKVGNILNEYDEGEDVVNLGTIRDVADAVEGVVDDYDGKEDITTLKNILANYRAAQEDSRYWGDRMDAGGDDAFEEALRMFASKGTNESYSINRDEVTVATPEMVAEANEELSREAELVEQLDEAQTALNRLRSKIAKRNQRKEMTFDEVRKFLLDDYFRPIFHF